MTESFAAFLTAAANFPVTIILCSLIPNILLCSSHKDIYKLQYSKSLWKISPFFPASKHKPHTEGEADGVLVELALVEVEAVQDGEAGDAEDGFELACEGG